MVTTKTKQKTQKRKVKTRKKQKSSKSLKSKNKKYPKIQNKKSDPRKASVFFLPFYRPHSRRSTTAAPSLLLPRCELPLNRLDGWRRVWYVCGVV
jgi:hypothetical protein